MIFGFKTVSLIREQAGQGKLPGKLSYHIIPNFATEKSKKNGEKSNYFAIAEEPGKPASLSLRKEVSLMACSRRQASSRAV